MPVGTVSDKGQIRSIKLLEDLAAANGAPSLATHGVPTNDLIKAHFPRTGALFIASTAGSGVIAVAYGRLWVYHPDAAVWGPAGIGADAEKGKINGGAALGETGTDMVRHAEPVELPGIFSRVYLELGTFGGTAPTFSAWLSIYTGREG